MKSASSRTRTNQLLRPISKPEPAILCGSLVPRPLSTPIARFCFTEIKGVQRGLGTSLPLWRLAEALGNTSESRALIGCFSSANYYSNCEPYLVIQTSFKINIKFISLCVLCLNISMKHTA